MTYIGIAATLGLPALAFFCWLVCKAWRSRRRPTELSLWGVMAGLALDGLGQDIESFRHVWVLIGLVLADAARSQNSEKRFNSFGSNNQSGIEQQHDLSS
jgi:hypothetical protein